MPTGKHIKPITLHKLIPAAGTNGAATAGILLAVVTTLIWSGNFIIARGVIHEIQPVSLAFFRWLTATLLLAPFAFGQPGFLWNSFLQHKTYYFWTALTGVTLFNTFIYIAGHYTSAINLALIGTTSSPVISVLLAYFFLKEGLTLFRLLGLMICIAGILLLLSKGSPSALLHLQFGQGDAWVLAAGCSFAIYNILVRRKPSGIASAPFLFLLFATGTLLLAPAWLAEQLSHPPVDWNLKTVGSIVYLGLGASVISFLCWNAAIARLGAGRTALFGNLIPVFSIIEAVFLLNEEFTWLHLLSGMLVMTGLLLANVTNPSQHKKERAAAMKSAAEM